MTWLRTGFEFALECADLSDAAYRTHHEALTWVMHREKGPVVTFRDVERFTESRDREQAVGELVAAKFWKAIPEGYRIVHTMNQQPTPKQIKKQRTDAAKRALEYRNRKKPKKPESPVSEGETDA